MGFANLCDQRANIQYNASKDHEELVLQKINFEKALASIYIKNQQLKHQNDQNNRSL